LKSTWHNCVTCAQRVRVTLVQRLYNGQNYTIACLNFTYLWCHLRTALLCEFSACLSS